MRWAVASGGARAELVSSVVSPCEAEEGAYPGSKGAVSILPYYEGCCEHLRSLQSLERRPLSARTHGLTVLWSHPSPRTRILYTHVRMRGWVRVHLHVHDLQVGVYVHDEDPS